MRNAPTADSDRIIVGKHHVRAPAPAGPAFIQQLLDRLHRLTWQTPIHGLRLRGRYPLKLLTVPDDPIRGDVVRGREILDGIIRWHGESQKVADCSFSGEGWSPGLSTHMQSFAWLRDLGALNDRLAAAPLAEYLMRAWLKAHGDVVSDQAWRGDFAGRRILFWTAYAPLILSSADIVYRSSVLNALGRTARHLEQSVGRMPAGTAAVEAWAGIVAAGLLMPGGEGRRIAGEAGLADAVEQCFTSDGGVLCRSPARLMDCLSSLAMLQKCYEARRAAPEPIVTEALTCGAAALMGVTLGDGQLSSWQGGLPLSKPDVDAALRGCGVRARPLQQAFDWGYQRLAQGSTLVVVDAGAPPLNQPLPMGCASTLAFELSDGKKRLIVNCGGAEAGAPPVAGALAQALRTTAAHSTLTLADSNLTALLPNGGLGKGVTEVDVDWQNDEAGLRLDASHDGYVKRFGLQHARSLTLRTDGKELRGQDRLEPRGRRAAPQTGFAIRFHLAQGVEATPTADGKGALLRIAGGPLWQFRCEDSALMIEDSLWIDAEGQLHPTQQLVISGDAPAQGASINWALRRAA
jgi:uncharacterized heparinase superfamily protein